MTTQSELDAAHARIEFLERDQRMLADVNARLHAREDALSKSRRDAYIKRARLHEAPWTSCVLSVLVGLLALLLYTAASP